MDRAPARHLRITLVTLGRMRSSRALYTRLRLLAAEVGKFGVVGAVAFVVTDAGTNLLHFRAGAGPLVSNLIASVIAMAISYLGNRYWTFGGRQRSGVRREGVLFLLLNGVGLAIQLACLGLATYVLGLHGHLSYNVALVVGIALGTLFRYWSYRTLIWRAQPVGSPARRRLPGDRPAVSRGLIM